MPIPIWNRNQGGIIEAQAQVVEAERIVDRVALRLTQRFEVVYQRYLNAKYQVEQYTKTGDTDRDNQGSGGRVVQARKLDKTHRVIHPRHHVREPAPDIIDHGPVAALEDNDPPVGRIGTNACKARPPVERPALEDL